ncbi:FtsX-like permease family protein [Anaerovorax odorimutans]|uniref:FtsX-like permease family protein n=1 Tax=Anaerovorax odorimutans TaxID=109327 RepID=UPI000403C1C5|nr:FtsX-like permease family protein [Anaerovorax odorimutans]
MNIFNKIALQGLKNSRTRTFVTIIGVVLSAAMITAVTTFGVSLLNYMANGAAQKYGDWHVAFLDEDSSFVQEQTNNDEVANTVTFENIGYAKLDGGKNPNKPYLFIAGFSEKSFDALPITLLSGRLPKNSGEILVSGSVMTKGKVQFNVGDTITLAAGNRMYGNEKLGQSDTYTAESETFVPQGERTYSVVGICQTPYFEEDFAPGYTVITTSDTTDTAEDLSLFVKLKNPRKVHDYVKSIDRSHSYILNNAVLRFMGLSDDSSDKIFNTLLYSVGGIVILIIMIGSVFLIYNSFNISLNERTHQFGILSSVGATAKQLRNSVLFEGLCIGAVGIPIGVIVGIAGIRLVIGIVAKNFVNLLYAGVPLTLTVSAPAILAAAVVSMVTILISADIPARKAASMPVMECIRQTNAVKVESKAVNTSKLAQRIYGLEGTLALKNFKRNKKCYRSIVLSLVLSIVLFVSTSAFVTDLRMASAQAKAVTTYDIGFGTQDMDDAEMMNLYDKLKIADGITKSSYQVVMKYICTVHTDKLSDGYWESAGVQPPDKTVNLPIKIQFLDGNTYLEMIKDLGLPAEEYMGQNGKLIAVAKMQDNSSQVDGVSQLNDMFTSSFLDVSVTPEADGDLNTEYGKNVSITCVEITPPDTPPTVETSEQQPYFFQVMAPYSSMETLATSHISSNIMVKGMTFQSKNPSQSMEEMKTMIQSVGMTASYIILNTSEMLEESRNYIFIANVFAYTFIIMISLIAVANVFNTISTNIKLRRRELAMLRSVGMSDADFNKMMRFECAFYGIRALLFGIPIALFSSWLIYKGMFVGGADGINFVLPWASMGISVFSVLLVIFVTMMYAVRKIKRENIIDALRDDMT